MFLLAASAIARAGDALATRAQVVGALVESAQCTQASKLAESILSDFNEPLAWEAVAVAALCAPDVVRASEAIPAYEARGGDPARARLLASGLTDAIKQGGLYDRAVLRAYLMAWPLGGALVATPRASKTPTSPWSPVPTPAPVPAPTPPPAPAPAPAPTVTPPSAAQPTLPKEPAKTGPSPWSKPPPPPPPPEEPEIPVARDKKGRPIVEEDELPEDPPEDLDEEIELPPDPESLSPKAHRTPPPKPPPRPPPTRPAKDASNDEETPVAAPPPVSSPRPPDVEPKPAPKPRPSPISDENRPELPVVVVGWVGGGVGRLAYEQIPLHDSTALFPESFHFNATTPSGELGARVGSKGAVSVGGQIDAWIASYSFAPASLCASAGSSCAEAEVTTNVHAVDALAYLRLAAPPSAAGLAVSVFVGGRESNIVAFSLAKETASIELLPLESGHVIAGAGLSTEPIARVVVEASWITELTPTPLAIHQFDGSVRVAVTGPWWVGAGYRGLNIVSDVLGTSGDVVGVVHYRMHEGRILAGVAF